MFSYNSYAWSPKIRKSDGLVRLVFGLGTRAVDRVGGDYPRMIPLSHPLLRPEATAEQVTRSTRRAWSTSSTCSGGRCGPSTSAPSRARPVTPTCSRPSRCAEEGSLRPPMFRTQELAGGPARA